VDMGGVAHFFSLAIEAELSTRLTVGSVLVRGSGFGPALTAFSGSTSSAALWVFWNTVFSGCVRSKIRCVKTQDELMYKFRILVFHVLAIAGRWLLVLLAFLLSQMHDQLSFHNCLTGYE